MGFKPATFRAEGTEHHHSDTTPLNDSHDTVIFKISVKSTHNIIIIIIIVVVVIIIIVVVVVIVIVIIINACKFPPYMIYEKTYVRVP